MGFKYLLREKKDEGEREKDPGNDPLFCYDFVRVQQFIFACYGKGNQQCNCYRC